MYVIQGVRASVEIVRLGGGGDDDGTMAIRGGDAGTRRRRRRRGGDAHVGKMSHPGGVWGKVESSAEPQALAMLLVHWRKWLVRGE